MVSRIPDWKRAVSYNYYMYAIAFKLNNSNKKHIEIPDFQNSL